MSQAQDGPDPLSLGELDPDQFVGEPPAGDVDPSDFSSNDQSADRTHAAPTTDDDSSTTEEDA